MEKDLKSLQFNSIEDIDQLIEALEEVPENASKENTYMKAELTRREKMLKALRELRKEADEIARQEALKKEAEVVRQENDELEEALERAKQLVKSKKQEVMKPVRKTSSYYGGGSCESRSGESRPTISHCSWGYSSGESRGESRW